jgi:HTH-type transcriptional regulator/antitoxin HigA
MRTPARPSTDSKLPHRRVVTAHYFELMKRFPVIAIESDEHLEEANQVIEPLMMRDDLDSGELAYLDILATQIERYEAQRYPIPGATDAEMLRHLIEARDITQSALAAETKISNSVISEVIHGKRVLTRSQVDTIASFFGVSSAVFK